MISVLMKLLYNWRQVYYINNHISESLITIVTSALKDKYRVWGHDPVLRAGLGGLVSSSDILTQS